jgi:hypothetical protein
MSDGHGGLYHLQSPECFFMGASGLKVRMSLLDFGLLAQNADRSSSLVLPSKPND